MKDRLPNTQETSLMDYVLQIYELCFSLFSPVCFFLAISAEGLMTGGLFLYFFWQFFQQLLINE